MNIVVPVANVRLPRWRSRMSAQQQAIRATALVAVTATFVMFVWVWPAPVASNKHDVTLLYIGSEDCAPCRAWQRDEGASFRSSAEFARITYREVKSPSLLDVLHDEYWPDDLRRYRDRLGRRAGVPLLLIIADQEVVNQAFGASQWHSAVVPKLKALLR